MTYKDLAIFIGVILLCLASAKPAYKNFLVVLQDKSNTRATPFVRMFVLIWSVIGLIAIGMMFVFSIYSLIVRPWPSM